MTFTGKGGKTIRIYRWEPETNHIEGVVQISHGMVEHALRYERLARDLTNKGYVVIANDHRGHGQTDPYFRGFIPEGDGFHLMTDDLNTLYLQIMKWYEEVPKYLVGHSMGSSLVLRLLQLYPLKPDGVILSGPPDPSAGLLREGAIVAGLLGFFFVRSAQSPLLNRLMFSKARSRFKPQRTQSDWLTRDRKEVDKYLKDSACGFICSNSFYRDFFNGLRAVYSKKNLALIDPAIPFYLLAGSEDPIANANKGINELCSLLYQSGIDRQTLKIYPDGRHEMFNELNREEVTDHLISWIKNQRQ